MGLRSSAESARRAAVAIMESDAVALRARQGSVELMKLFNKNKSNYAIVVTLLHHHRRCPNSPLKTKSMFSKQAAQAGMRTVSNPTTKDRQEARYLERRVKSIEEAYGLN